MPERRTGMNAWRPIAYRRSFSPSLGQTFDKYLGMTPAMGDVLRLVYHGGGTWLGIHVALKESGFMSGFGWFLGLGMGIAGILDLVSLGERAAGTHPPD